MRKYIDTHAHYGHKKFKQNIHSVLNTMYNYTERIIQIGTNSKTNEEVMNIIDAYDYVYGMIGYFPTDIWEIEPDYFSNATQNWNAFVHNIQNDKIVGIGEIGLDYSWDRVGRFAYGEQARDMQKKWFVKQLDLAHETNLPVSIHSRDAEEDTMQIFNNYTMIRGVIHCFSYGKKAAKQALDKGLYLGIGGTSTYPNNHELRSVIKMAPMDRLLLETDAPYLSPQQVRREINTSANIKYVVENIANIKGVTCEQVIEITNNNAYSLFNKMR
jgi:TatD DNase family protein